jgi:hypothetical protein
MVRRLLLRRLMAYWWFQAGGSRAMAGERL